MGAFRLRIRIVFLKFYDPRPCFIGFCGTYFAGYRTPAIGVATVAGRNDGLRRIVLAAGQLGASEGGPLHGHHGREILHFVSGEVEVIGASQETSSSFRLTPHRFTTITETAMEVVAELDAGQIFPVADADGTTRLVQVYRSDMPWSRQPQPGSDSTSDEKMTEILRNASSGDSSR